MARTRPHERVFALTAALLFLVTTVAVTGVVIWQARNEDKTLQSSQGNLQEIKLEGTKLENFTPVASVDKVQANDLTEGSGEVVKPGATITFHYTGALAKDGTVFQTSYEMGQPVTYALADLIPGWQEGIPGMKVGGKRRLLIPASLAYGAEARPGIPANSDLVFDIEITAVQ